MDLVVHVRDPALGNVVVLTLGVLSQLDLVAFEPVHARIAADVVATYGKGSGHPARLNFGDCMTYAVAKERGLPLLYVGNDFRHTDIPDALNAE